jgi:hypothetical protein
VCAESMYLFEEEAFGADVGADEVDHFLGPSELVLDFEAVVLPDDFTLMLTVVRFLRVLTSNQQHWEVSM